MPKLSQLYLMLANYRRKMIFAVRRSTEKRKKTCNSFWRRRPLPLSQCLTANRDSTHHGTSA